MNDMAKWARAVGLDVRSKPEWSLQIAIETHGKTPPRIAGGLATRFWIMVSSSCWWVDVWHRGKNFSYSWSPYRKMIHHRTLSFTPPRDLASVGRFLARVERRLGVHFRRDRPVIQSNVKGGAKAVFAWIQGL
jgi:hypothetical protein